MIGSMLSFGVPLVPSRRDRRRATVSFLKELGLGLEIGGQILADDRITDERRREWERRYKQVEARAADLIDDSLMRVAAFRESGKLVEISGPHLLEEYQGPAGPTIIT
jgi:hypothetical protein